MAAISIDDEFSKLQRVIIGLGVPYQTDKDQVASEMSEFPFVPNTDRKQEVLALTYPTEEILLREYADYVEMLESYGVEVLRADPTVAYSFDYTCPRDIGFVIGDRFFVANMAVPSRTDEITTIRHLMAGIDPVRVVQPPTGALLEGGDVILFDTRTILVGINQRSNLRGYIFLKDYLSPLGYRVLPVEHNQLHLDCCLNPLGRGHLLIHPESLKGDDAATWQVLETLPWIQVDAIEREHLATNVLSINPDTVIARSHVVCARVNSALRDLGYRVEEVDFDGVPATGGSFRCASLVLSRAVGG
jgi:N-dimethylarginine dimethylaminohydrolase